MAVLLYNKTCYSLLTSTIKVNQLVEFAKANGYQQIGICDTNVLFAVQQFYEVCQKENIKPIIGLEVKVKINAKSFPFLVYCLNEDGYQELIQLSYLVNTNEEITMKMINSLSNNCAVVIISDGYLSSYVINNKIDELKKLIGSIKENQYIGIYPNDVAYQAQYNQVIYQICTEMKKPVIGIKLALYCNKDDFSAYQALCAIKQQTTIYDIRLNLTLDANLINPNTFDEIFPKDVVEETDKFVNKINIDFSKTKTTLPNYVTPDKVNTVVYLKNLCLAGLKKRISIVDDVYLQRLNYELDIITEMDFTDYFLIIYDLILYARRNDIYVGPGRGSCVGSLVAYCLGITHINPVKYELFFERFLNPERISLPDIDIDIPDNDREKMINYVVDKYGFAHVAHIITFGTLATKAVIKDVGKALNITTSNLDLINKKITNPKISLIDYYNTNKEFKTIIDASDENRNLLKIAIKLQGLPKNVSTHASGIIISKAKLSSIIPVTLVNDCLTSQYSMEYLEQFGLIKIDFLGLKNLTMIKDIYQSVYQDNIIDIFKLSLQDQPTYELLSKGNTNGIFQLESNGMKDFLVKIKPRCFEDIAVTLALYRPGPMEYIPQYLSNRNHPESIKYLHPDLKPILQSTYGIIVYQEQIMQLVRKVAGFSLGKADILRRAISKKNEKAMAQLQNEYIEGALANGYSKEVAVASYQLISKFANYGFNKSHAYAYSLVAYQLAYFKANFPLSFYISLLNSSLGCSDSINAYVSEARAVNIKVLPVSINKSSTVFTIENGCIRYPLSQIKDISPIDANNIIENRDNYGLFTSYINCFVRLYAISRKTKIINALIRSGALSEFKETTKTMLNSIPQLTKYADLCIVYNNDQLQLDFDLVDEPQLISYQDNENEVLMDQFEYLGIYLNQFPLEKYRTKYPNLVVTSKLSYVKPGNFSILIIIKDVRELRTRLGDKMAFVNGYDEYGTITIAVMPKQYELYKKDLNKGIMVYVEASKDISKDSYKLNKLNLLKG